MDQRTVADLEEGPVVRIQDHVTIPLSDGTILSARIWFPDALGRYPVILEYHPYPKRYITADRDEIGHGFFAENGYVSIRVDMRGSGASEGYLSDEYTELARRDGVEVIEWIARQEWCTGAVGMYGLSWGGYNGIQMATIAPEPLKAIVVAGATDDRFENDTHFLGGVMASEHVGWAVTLLSFLTRPPDPTIVGKRWRAMWLDRLNKLEWILPLWLAHPWRDAYWTEGFPRNRPKGLRVPTLITGGVADVYINAILRMVGCQPDTVKGVIGPWGHHFPHRALPEPAIDWLNQSKRWFDRWLQGIETGVESDPELRIFVTEGYVADGRSEGVREGQWLAATAKQLEEAPSATFNFSYEGDLTEIGTAGMVNIATAATVGMAGGELMPMGWGIDLPSEQRVDDALSICFETGPLKELLQIIGKARLTLKLRSSAPTGYVVARLCDVTPNGQSTRVAIGAYELSTAGGSREHVEMRPEAWQTVTIELNGMAHRFAPGHRIRLALSNSYWPLLWPSNQAATLQLYLAASHLQLPMPIDLKSYEAFGPGDGAEPLPKQTLSEPIFERELIQDMPMGKVSYRISDTAPRIRFEDHGMETWNSTTRTYEIDEQQPERAKMTIRRDIGFSRDTWQVSTRVDAVMHSDASHYTARVSLKVLEGEVEIFSRDYLNTSPRFP